MWSMVMFDLPVLTAVERRDATKFRKVLQDLGYSMLQFSVYVRYIPIGGLSQASFGAIKRALPHGGEVRIFHISDRQWSTAFRFESAAAVEPESTPAQLAFL